jgi:hypothetical protein
VRCRSVFCRSVWLLAALVPLTLLAAGIADARKEPRSAAARQAVVQSFASQWTTWYDAPAAFDASGVTLSSPVAASPDETYSTLVTSKKTWRDQTFSLTMTTLEQRRTGSAPNPWEVGWVMFRFRDLANYYWFVMTTDGFELGKKQGSDKQIFLVTGDLPRVTIGVRRRVQVRTQGARIRVVVDGTSVVDFTDPDPLLGPGSVGLYEEDSTVRVESVSLG